MSHLYPYHVRQPMIREHGNMYQTNPSYAIPLLREAVQDERSDELFYDYLIRHAPSQEDREVITAIRNDERKHRRMFREMYTSLTGQTLEGEEAEPFTPPSSYLDGLRRAIFGESGAVELYRKIYFTIPGKAYKNMVFEILTDELKHGIRYNYLYAKNK